MTVLYWKEKRKIIDNQQQVNKKSAIPILIYIFNLDKIVNRQHGKV